MSEEIKYNRRRFLGIAAMSVAGAGLESIGSASAHGKYAHRTIMGGVGHNLPQEAPQAFAKAVVDVDRF